MTAYQVHTDVLSASTSGRPIRITSSTATSAQKIHLIGQDDVLDCVWMSLRNRGSGIVRVFVVVNPDDDTILTDVQNAGFPIDVPNRSEVSVLEGLRVRRSNTAYTIAVYLSSSGDSGKIQVTGYINRTERGQITY